MSAGAEYRRLLASATARAGLESEGLHAGEVGDPVLDLARLRNEIRYLEDWLGERADPEAVEQLLAGAERGLREVAENGESARLDPERITALEAVVHSNGSRPVLFVDDDFIDVLNPAALGYAASLSRIEPAVRHVCRAVGKVVDPAASLGYQGTAWAVGDGVVLTNYHVLRAASLAPGIEAGRFTGTLKPGIAVDFGGEVGGGPDDRVFPVRRVLAAGAPGRPEYADPQTALNFDGLDLAVLELEKVPGRSFPDPVAVARSDDPLTRGALASRGRGVYVVGFPGNDKSTTPDIFGRLFAGVKGVKRLAPGILTQGRGEVERDPRKWILGHDASTLGGSSGSLLVDLETDGRVVLGLHFAGLPDRVNWAHGLEGATAELREAVPGW